MEHTSGTTIGVDGGSGTLSLSSAELGNFTWGKTLAIGDGNASNIVANGDSSRLNVGSVSLVSGGNITLGGAWSKSSGGADTFTAEAAGNIALGGYALSGASGDALSVVMDANSGGAGGGVSGLGNITTWGGDIYMGGGALDGSGHPTAGYSVGSSSSGSQYGLYLNAVTLNAGGGNISLRGEGGTYAGGGDDGVYAHGSTVQTSGSGAITLNGEGGAATSGTNYGVYLDKATVAGNVTSAGGGAISVTGIQGSGGTEYGIGADANSDSIGGPSYSGNLTLQADTVSFGSGASIKTSGNITVEPYTAGQTIGVGAGTGNLSLTDTYLGYFTFGSGKTFTIGDNSAGAIDINSANTLLNTGNVNYISNGAITVGGAISKTAGPTDTLTLQAGTDITLNANDTISGASGYALNVLMDADYANGGGYIYLNSFANVTSWGGNITMGGGNGTISAGNGFAVGDSGNGTQYGIYEGAIIKAGGGNIIMNGHGGSYASGNNYGVYFNAGPQTSGTGTITINGGGGNGGSGIYANNVNIMAGGSGAITLTGTAGTSSDWGINLTNASITSGTGTVTLSSPNDIYIHGNINSATSSPLDIVVDANSGGGTTGGISTDGYVWNTSGGNIYMGGGALDGSGHPTGTAYGDAVNGYTGVSLNHTTVNADGGDIIINGHGGNASGATNIGIDFFNGPTVETSGGGNITLTGAGGAGGSNAYNVGIGEGGSGVPIVSSTGNGAITLIGVNGVNSGGAYDGLRYFPYVGDAPGSTAYSGNIVLQADAMVVGNAIKTSGNITVKEYTPGTTIGVGTGTGTLSLTDTELGYFTFGSGKTFTIGDSSAGAIDINSANTLLNTGNVNYISNGAITVGGAISKTAGATDTLTLQAGTDITLNANDTISGASGYVLNVLMDSDYANGGGAISISGNITTWGGNITLGGQGSPTTFAAVGDSTYASGIYLNGTTLNAVGGNIALNGSGYASGSDIVGFYMFGSSIVETSGTGNIAIIGTGGSGTIGNHGIYLNTGTNTIENTGSGSITLTGIGGTGAGGYNDGIVLNPGTNTIVATGGGNMTLTGIAGRGGGSNYGLITANGANTIGGALENGNITLIQNSILFNYNGGTTAIQTSGNITVEPYTVSTNMSVGSAASALGLSTTYLGYLNGGSYTFGDANDTGTLTAAAYGWSAPVSFITKSNGLIDVTGTQTGTGSATLSFTGPTTLAYAGTDATTNNAAITFNSNVTLAANATTNSGTAFTTFASPVDGDYNLTASAGSFSLGGAWGGSAPLAAVSLTSANALSLPAIKAASVFAQTTGGTSDLTLTGQLLASGTGTPVTLVAARDFINSDVSDAGNAIDLTGGSSPRWLIYSTTPLSNTLDGLTEAFHRYSCTYGGSCPSFPSTGDGLLYTLSPTITVTADDISGTYGSIAAFTASYSGYVGSDNFASSLSGAPSLTTNATLSTSGNYNYNATPWTITPSAGTLASPLGYQISYVNAPTGLTVAQKPITITGLSGTNKTYDTITNDPVTGTASLNGVVTNDIVTLANGSASFSDLNVGNGKTVTFSGYSISGHDAADYSLTQPASSTADIILPDSVEAIFDPQVSTPTPDGNTIPRDLIYVDVALLQSLGYSENDPHPWWDRVLTPETRDRP